MPPLTLPLARRVLTRGGVAGVLARLPGDAAAGRSALERFLVDLGRLVVERPRIKAVEVAPLLVLADRVVALDARVVLHAPAVADEDLPRPALRPDPAAEVTPWAARDGGPMVIRPVRVGDEPLLARFHEAITHRDGASGEPSPAAALPPDRLARICREDPSRAWTLLADYREPWTEYHSLLGMGRLRRRAGTDEADFALRVVDHHQGRGIGTELLRRLLRFARSEGVRRVVVDLDVANHGLHRVAEKVGFTFESIPDPAVIRATLDLTGYVEPTTYADTPTDRPELPQADPEREPNPEES